MCGAVAVDVDIDRGWVRLWREIKVFRARSFPADHFVQKEISDWWEIRSKLSRVVTSLGWVGGWVAVGG